MNDRYMISGSITKLEEPREEKKEPGAATAGGQPSGRQLASSEGFQE